MYILPDNGRHSGIKTSWVEHHTRAGPQSTLSITKAHSFLSNINSAGYKTVVFKSAEDWDYWPNGAFKADISDKIHRKTRGLMVHWATSTYRVPSGPTLAKRWKKGHYSKHSCQGIITCENDSCQEEAQFINLCDNNPGAGPAKFIAGIPILSGDRCSVANISPTYVNISHVTKDCQKLKASVPRGGDTFILDFSYFDCSHPTFVTSGQISAVTVFTMQSKFMKSLLLKNYIADELVNGFVTDETHKYFADHNAFLLITATYLLELNYWVLVQFAYLNRATAGHY
ncbi:hypothetical protein CONPUDRAFT_74641 [Coniophora puteana RWD-64-598 SS2]|uniref:Uncharacterized protein n=1 Tax=Coniophora puteana (strain RWD-64-598) TaxID=741705 RepID=A0A5M3MKP9_CONPW|nr:uncharacterized protein CONPUDRAFT_74641 [Coniophora puteana RWD-64-598 SS2]EIW79131.1 hypothetical protein CONPUDRAFT_74641 [Coniophora puteana RWD-64-598 SS2]